MNKPPNVGVLACLALLALASASAQLISGLQGTVHGSVSMKDGSPLGGVTVTLTVFGGTTMTVTTSAAGTFSTQVPTGRVTAQLGTGRGSISSTVMLAPGGTAQLRLVITDPGVLVTFTDLNGNPIDVDAEAAYKTPTKTVKDLTGTDLGVCGTWFPGVPANATDLAVIAGPSGGTKDNSPLFARQCTLQAPAGTGSTVPVPASSQRRESIALPLADVRVQVVDSNGNPVANATLSGFFVFPKQTALPDYWDTTDPATTQAKIPVNNATTNKFGTLELGLIMPGAYEVMLANGTVAGPFTPFTVDENGQSSLLQYVLAPQAARPGARDVTQFVFGADGRPLAGAEVWASYAWQGVAYLDRAVSDNRGGVVWAALPPVRVIVWGANVPAGVIPPDVALVEGPLPAPAPGPTMPYRFTVDNVGSDPTTIHWLFTLAANGTNAAPDHGDTSYQPAVAGGAASGVSVDEPIISGTLFSMLAYTDTIPLRVAHLSNVYAPYIDDWSVRAEYTQDMEEGAGIQGTLVRSDGQPVDYVSRLDITAISATNDFSDLLQQMGLDPAKFLRVRQLGGGQFTASVPGPGTYRITVDMLDTTTPSTLTITEGNNKVTITLPAPLFTAPGGARLSWLSVYQPDTVREFNVLRSTTPVPVYGSKATTLAVWFTPSPSHLSFLSGFDGRALSLTLRSVILIPQDVNGNPYGGSVTLLPLLPLGTSGTGVSPVSLTGGALVPVTATADSLTAGFSVSGQAQYVRSMWPGRYLVEDADHSELGPLTSLTVADSDGQTLRFTVDTTRHINRPGLQRLLSLTFPAGGTGVSPVAAGAIMVIPDAAPGSPIRVAPADAAAGAVTIAVPVATQHLTVQWLGVGVMLNVPLPPQPIPTAPFTANLSPVTSMVLPAWQRGYAYAARLLDDNGQPLPLTTLRIGTPGMQADDYLSLTTDAAASFSLVGVLPGALLITGTGSTVPVPGTMNSWTLPMTASDSLRNILRTGAASREPAPVVLYRTLDTTLALPGAITVYMQAGGQTVPVSFPATLWQPSTLLNVACAPLGKLPPGSYRVTVNTTQGPVSQTITVTDEGGYAIPDGWK